MILLYATCICEKNSSYPSTILKGVLSRHVLQTRVPDRGSDGILNLLVLFQTLCCGYSLESSLRDDSNEYPQHRV